MIAFIQEQPDIVERLLQHIEVSPFVDLLVRIIQLDEHAAGSGVLEVRHLLSTMARLLTLLYSGCHPKTSFQEYSTCYPLNALQKSTAS